jgi:flagellar hook protein FlgE
MMRSLFAAVSGLRNHQLSMSVIGNNIANINTIGFKGGRAIFQEMLSQTIQGASAPTRESAGTNPLQIGLGMSVGSVSSAFTQGQLQLTGNMMDMAVQGEGFFVLRGGGQNLFGRAGAFGFDGDGRLTAGEGLLVQGWMADPAGRIGTGSAIADIELPFGQTSPARATSEIEITSNLDSSAEALSTITETSRILATALSTDELQNLFNSRGQSLGIQEGDALTIRYAGTAETLVTNLATTSGAPLDIEAGDQITVSDGTRTTQLPLPFDPNWTLAQFATELENALNSPPLATETDISVNVNSDGSLNFSNPSGGNNADLTVTVSAAGRDVFNSLIASVPVINGTSTARSEPTLVHRTITVGTTFTNMVDFAANIEQVLQLGSSGASVVFDNGRLTYDNSAGTSNLVDLVMTRPGASTAFADSMGLTGVNLDIGDSTQSDLLLDIAEANDFLVDLYSTEGTHLGLTNGDVFSFDAKEGGSPLSQVTFSIVLTGDGTNVDRQVQTLGGLVSELENVLRLTTAGGVELNEGRIRVTGKSGLSNELTDLVFSETNNPIVSAALSFAEIQAATDVTHEASIRVFDALGTAHLLELVFTKDNDSPNRWTWDIDFEDGEVLSGGSGSVSFNGDGSLAEFVSDDGEALRLDPGNGANGPIEIDFDAGTRGGIDGITGFARASTASIVDQDGYAMGTLESISIDGSGIITGVFTNGTSRPLAQMALAIFKNPVGLQRDGAKGWISTPNSGQAVVRRPGAGSEVGSISAGTLEMSNVDIAQEFTTMIVAQRGFQANARTVTTSDEMLVELVNLKR